MNSSIFLLFELLFMLINIRYSFGVAKRALPILNLNTEQTNDVGMNKTIRKMKYLPFIMLIDKNKDNSEYWRETEILSLVHNDHDEARIDLDECQNPVADIDLDSVVHFPSKRTVRPICKGRLDNPPIFSRSNNKHQRCGKHGFYKEIYRVENRTYVHRHRLCRSRRTLKVATTRRKKNKLWKEISDQVDSMRGYRNDFQLCPQCAHFNNYTECELFRDSCLEQRVLPNEQRTYCDRKYGKWRTMFIPADYSQCRCCDECVFYRELDQSCIEDEYNFDHEETLPVRTIDFRAGCNPYWGHHEQEYRALRCDKLLRRCVPVSTPTLPNETLNMISPTNRRNFRYEPPTGGEDCPMSCRGYFCYGGLVTENQCPKGAFLPDKEQCNCCGRCSTYQQLNEKCAEFKKTVHIVNGSKEIEVEEEFLEPGCDDGLVCRQGRCQDIHTVQTTSGSRRKRDDGSNLANEPCKRELKYFKKKYGSSGHLHYEAPQCTPLWLYAPVQCRRFVCYCALEDGSIIQGIKVPRVEVSNMNCDCAREKCRLNSDVECDGFGNYKEALFVPHMDDWSEPDIGVEQQEIRAVPTIAG